MADVFTPEKRSEVMYLIRGWDTQPELALRSMLHRLGYRFTVRGPKNRLLPGKPDLVLPKYHSVIFVHGCFWHGHEHCPAFRLPKSRSDWWQAKISGNRSRDLRNETGPPPPRLARRHHLGMRAEEKIRTAVARRPIAKAARRTPLSAGRSAPCGEWKLCSMWWEPLPFKNPKSTIANHRSNSSELVVKMQ